jgi:hypothetical protein
MSGTTEDTAPKKISQRTIVVAVVVAAVVLAAVAVLIFVLAGDDDDGTDTSNFAGQSTSAVPPGTSAPGSAPASAPAPAQPGPGGGTQADAATVQVVAEQVVQAFNAHDPAAMKKISCDQDTTELSIPAEGKVELASPPELTSDTATVELRLTIGDTSTTIPLPLRKQDGNWCAE